jgi:iron-sulfur cluster assembly protein
LTVWRFFVLPILVISSFYIQREILMADSMNPVETGVEFHVSPDAITEVKRLMAQEQEQDIYLRIGVVPGGCSGMSYQMAFDNEKSEFDLEFDFDNVKVLIDETAMLYINGATLDYDKKMMGGGFNFVNPNATRSCGCGSSFRC